MQPFFGGFAFTEGKGISWCRNYLDLGDIKGYYHLDQDAEMPFL